METTLTRQREQAHKLIDRMAPGQIAAMVGLMEILIDPVARSLANAPYDDEPVSDEEVRDIAEARAAYARGEVVSNDDVLAEFGLTADNFERMGQVPVEASLEPEPQHP